MEKYEDAKKALEAEEVHVKEYEAAASKRRDDLKNKEARLKEEAERLEKEVAELESQIDKQPLRLYRRLIESKGDSAIVPVVNDCTCGGCHMKLTQQEVVDARRGTDIVQCSNCGRVLYWKSEFA
jgi:predicted  nucleic acid-binding Zn-ribbon protein